MRTIEDRVKQILSEQLGIKEDSIHGSSSLVEDLGLDSLDLVELVMQLEDEFDIEIPDYEAEKFFEVQQLIDYVFKNT